MTWSTYERAFELWRRFCNLLMRAKQTYWQINEVGDDLLEGEEVEIERRRRRRGRRGDTFEQTEQRIKERGKRGKGEPKERKLTEVDKCGESISLFFLERQAQHNGVLDDQSGLCSYSATRAGKAECLSRGNLAPHSRS